MSLTRGALARICAGEEVPQPNMQVLGYKRIAGSGEERYRILLSDGVYSNSFSMLATHLNPMIHNNELEQFTIIRVGKYICNQVQGQSKRVVILLEVSVVKPGEQVGEKIGNPAAMRGDGSAKVQNQNANPNVGRGAVKRPNEQQPPPSHEAKKPMVNDQIRPANTLWLAKEETFKLRLDHCVHLDVKEKEGRGLEEILDLSGNSVENQKYLNLISEERMKRENVCMKKDEESTHIVIEKIEKINKKIKDSEQRWMKVVEKLDLESERLARKHQEEKTQQELERKKLARKHLEEETQQEWEREKLEKRHQEEKTKQENTFAREAEGNKQHITNLTDVRNDLAQDLEKIHFDKGKNDDHDKLEAARGSLECPICLESMEPPKKIWMCIRTHAICEDCKILLDGKPCPTCESGSVNLRAYMIEKMAGIVFSKSEV